MIAAVSQCFPPATSLASAAINAGCERTPGDATVSQRPTPRGRKHGKRRNETRKKDLSMSLHIPTDLDIPRLGEQLTLFDGLGLTRLPTPTDNSQCQPNGEQTMCTPGSLPPTLASRDTGSETQNGSDFITPTRSNYSSRSSEPPKKRKSDSFEDVMRDRYGIAPTMAPDDTPSYSHTDYSIPSTDSFSGGGGDFGGGGSSGDF